MESKIRLVDTNFKNLPVEEKQIALGLMDIMMKKLHEKDLMITDFNPANIYFQDGIYSFEQVSPISSFSANNKDEAIFMNILGLANFAFCSYLPDYRLENGLLSSSVISENFNSFISYLPEEDRNYYKSILVDGYHSGKLPGGTAYYSDYLIKNHDNASKGNKSSLAYLKSTAAGRAFAKQDEAAFGHNFFFLTVVASITIMLSGIVLYFFSYFG